MRKGLEGITNSDRVSERLHISKVRVIENKLYSKHQTTLHYLFIESNYAYYISIRSLFRLCLVWHSVVITEVEPN